MFGRRWKLVERDAARSRLHQLGRSGCGSGDRNARHDQPRHSDVDNERFCASRAVRVVGRKFGGGNGQQR
jgi:hypothetical protein